MDALYDLKDKLCQELEEYGDKELSAGSLSTIDSLAHTIKNLDKIIEKYEESEGMSYDDGMRRIPMDGRDGMSYARGRGRNAKRDSMGRYSSAGKDMAMELRELMEEAPENMKMEFQKLINKMERM